MASSQAHLCEYCLNLFPLSDGSVDHHETVLYLLQSAPSCAICSTISTHWLLDDARIRFPDIDNGRYGSLSLSVKIRDVVNRGLGVSWALVKVSIEVSQHSFVFESLISITVCDIKCKAADQKSRP